MSNERKIMEAVTAIKQPAEPGDSSIEAVREYARLMNEKMELEEALTRVEGQAKGIEEAVLSYFQQNSVDRIKVEGRTLYLRRELWAGRADDTDNDVAVQALYNAGLADMAAPRINTMKLSAWVREREQTMGRQENVDDVLPPELRGAIHISEVFKIGSRRSS